MKPYESWLVWVAFFLAICAISTPETERRRVVKIAGGMLAIALVVATFFPERAV